MVAELLSMVGPATKLSGGDKSPTLTATSSADSRSGNIDSKFSTGSFSVGGAQTTNTVFIVAGVIALVFLLSKYFKK